MTTRSAIDILQELRYGTLVDDLSEKLQEVVSACDNTRKVGELRLTIKIKPGKSGEVEITDQIKATIPELPKGGSIMYVTPEGNLQRQDPRQMTLDHIKEIGREERKEIKTV